MMFTSLSVGLERPGMHCDHTVHFTADLSLRIGYSNVLSTQTRFMPAIERRRYRLTLTMTLSLTLTLNHKPDSGPSV